MANKNKASSSGEPAKSVPYGTVNETPPAPLTAELQRALDDNSALQAKLDEALSKLSVSEDDNAVLQRRLDEANTVVANLTQENTALHFGIAQLRDARAVAPVPAGLIGVTTAQVDNLPSIEQFPAHATMLPPAEPGVPETRDQRDVREHIERKRAAREKMTDEGTKT